MNNASLQLSSNDNTDRIEFEQFSHILASSLAPISSPGFRAFASSRDTVRAILVPNLGASDKTLAMALKAADWTSATKFSSFSSQVCFSILVVVTVVVAAFFFP